MQIAVEKKREVLSLITGVTYANVPSWYGATRRDLHMDLIVPKNRVGHAPCPCIVWFCGGKHSFFTSASRDSCRVLGIDGLHHRSDSHRG